jgi:hypothetical protein
MCNDIAIMKYDKRRPGLPYEAVVMKVDNNRTEM